MSKRFSAKPPGPVFIVGIARGILVRVGHRDLIAIVEIVVNLRVDLLAAVAADGRNGWSNGKDVFAAAVFVARPAITGGIQSVTHFVVIWQWHLVQKTRHESCGIHTCPILIPGAVCRRRWTDLNVRTVRIHRGWIQDGSKDARVVQRAREGAAIEWWDVRIICRWQRVADCVDYWNCRRGAGGLRRLEEVAVVPIIEIPKNAFPRAWRQHNRILSGASVDEGVVPQREEEGLVLRSEEHTSELQSQSNLVCRLLLEKKKNNAQSNNTISITRLIIPKYRTDALYLHLSLFLFPHV